MKQGKRHNARIIALQALYECDMAKADPDEIRTRYLSEINLKQNDFNYFSLIFNGVAKDIENIDNVFAEFLEFKKEFVTPIELAVLRIATFELLHCPEAPYKVVINEALELTKQFGTDEGFRFVNGILDKVSKKVRVYG